MESRDLGPCTLWEGTLNHDGYGRIGDKLAHRVLWEQEYGPIETGLELDHLCRVRACVRLSHLEPVTHAENVRRGFWGTRTRCVREHEFTDENTRMNADGSRACKTCQRDNSLRYYHRKKAKT